MGRRAFVILVCLVAVSRAQDSYHEALLEYFEQAERLEQGSGNGPGGLEEDTEEEAPPTRIVRCLKCSEMDVPDMCTPTNLRRELHEYIVECTGHCLNISAGASLVYGCAEERHGRTNGCITRADTRICVCSNDLCNGPDGILTEKEEEDYFEINTQPPYVKEIVPQRSHENSCSHIFISLHILSFSMSIAFFQNSNLRFQLV